MHRYNEGDEHIGVVEVVNILISMKTLNMSV